MSPRRAALVTLAIFLGLFTFQLLWTHGQLERLRGLGRRGRRSTAALQQQPHKAASAGLDSVAGGGEGVAGAADDEQAAAEAALAAARGTEALPDAAVVVFAYNRPDYLNQTLHSLLALRGLARYTVYVSQDGNDSAVAEVAARLAPHFLRAARGFALWQKAPRVPALSPNQPGHAWLAQHYRWGLDRVFLSQRHSHAVVVEDDMLFSPDFLLLFEATAPLLAADPSLWCVSSWNDNGFAAGHAWNASRLFRTSYFPGLGWMLRRELWLELGPKWPLDHWDHWMRDGEVSRGRDCVCPELNRNRNIGEVGANMDRGAFRRYLATMGWNANRTVTDWGDLSRLLLPAYTDDALRALAGAERWEVTALGGRRGRAAPVPGATYVLYYTIEQYQRLALRMKLWPFPRGHFQHLTSVPWQGARFLLADRRFCELIPEREQLAPSAGLHALAAERAQSCVDACGAQGMLCSAPDFWWLNTCAALRRYFPCERGCTVELGPDVPAYVADPGQALHAYCLVTQKASTCRASHAATARLCACVPLDSEAVARPGNGTAARRRALADAGSGAAAGGAAAQAWQAWRRRAHGSGGG